MSAFSKIEEDQIIHKGKYFFLVRDIYPVSPGHTLIISKEEKLDFFELDQEERAELPEMIFIARQLIEKEYVSNGYNIGMNCGEVAGQTVMHFHCHVIPRYKGDMGDPRGGVRHSVEGKGYY